MPMSWLQGLITPIHVYKGKGTQNDLQNYRGITVNSNIEKVFEIINPKLDNRKLYVAFLDISKAYDKAWLDGIMYIGFLQTALALVR